MAIGFGTFNSLPIGTPPWTARLEAPNPATVVSKLALYKSKGLLMYFATISGNRDRWSNSDGTFNFNTWKAEVDKFDGVTGWESYMNSGFMINFLIDEPYISTFKGTCPNSMVRQMGLYSKSKWPNLKTVVRSAAKFMKPPPEGWAGAVDYGWSQFLSLRGETATQFFTREQAQLNSYGLGMVPGYNVLNGGDGSSKLRGPNYGTNGVAQWMPSAAEIRNVGLVVSKLKNIPAFMMWTYPFPGLNPSEQPWLSYVQRQDYVDAFNYVAGLLGNVVPPTPGPPLPPGTPPPPPVPSGIPPIPEIPPDPNNPLGLPTDIVSETPTGDPDLKYTKYFGNTDLKVHAYQVGIGMWYGAVIPYDTNGAPGPVSWAKVEIKGDTLTVPSLNKLVVITQPPDVVASGATLNPAPAVQLQTSAGVPILDAGVTIIVTTKDTVLGVTGTTSVGTDATGTAIFSDLQVTGVQAAQDQLVFSSAVYVSALSNTVQITPIISVPTIKSSIFITPMISGTRYGIAARILKADGTSDRTAGVPITFSLKPEVSGGSGETYVIAAGGGPLMIDTNPQGEATLGISITGPTGVTNMVFSSPGYADYITQDISIIGDAVQTGFSLSNVYSNFRSLTIPTQGSNNVLTLYWSFPAQFDEPNTAGTIDIYVWSGQNSNNAKVIVLNLPVWTTQFNSLIDNPFFPGTPPDFSGNYSLPPIIAVPIAFPGFPWITVNYKLVFKVNGVISYIGNGSQGFFGSTSLV